MSCFISLTARWWCTMQAGWLQSCRNRQSATLSSPRGWSSRKAEQNDANSRSSFANGIGNRRRNFLRSHYRTCYEWIRSAATTKPKYWLGLGKPLNQLKRHAFMQYPVPSGLNCHVYKEEKTIAMRWRTSLSMAPIQ